MVSIPPRKEKLFKHEKPPHRIWPMPPHTLTLRDFKILLRRRNKSLQKYQNTLGIKPEDNNGIRGPEGTKGNALDVPAGGVRAVEAVKEKEKEKEVPGGPLMLFGVDLRADPRGKGFAASGLRKSKDDISTKPLNSDAVHSDPAAVVGKGSTASGLRKSKVDIPIEPLNSDAECFDPAMVVGKRSAALGLKKLKVDIPIEPLNSDSQVPDPSESLSGYAPTAMSVISSSGSNYISSSPSYSSASSSGTWF